MLPQQQGVVSSFSLVSHSCTPRAILIFQKLFSCFFTASWDSLSGYFFTAHFKHLIGSSSSLTQVNTKMESPAWAAIICWCRRPFIRKPHWAITYTNMSQAQLRPTHGSEQVNWRNTLPQLGKTHQKKTKVRGGKKSQPEAFIILFIFLEFYTTLPHLCNGSETLTNTLKRQKHTRDLVPEPQNRTGSQNWETSDLLRPTQSGKKWSFDWNVAILAQSSYLLHWLQYWCLEQQQYHIPHFEQDMFGFILHIVHS